MYSDSQLKSLASTTLVIVADSVVLDAAAIHLLSKDIDRTERRHVEELVAAIRPLLKDIVIYDSPNAFIEAIARHKADLVLPDWSGRDSWNRSGLVPAVCESAGIAYIGGDAYTKIVCQDKFLAKSLCTHVGLRTPSAIFVDSPEKLDALDLCAFPCVVKPCYEGSSIGVDDKSLVNSASEAHTRAMELLNALKAPVLVETFQPGREISICLLGNQSEVALVEAGERYLPNDEHYFDRNVFSFELKKNSKRTALRLATADVPPIYFDQARRLFKLLQKVEILRVDGRLNGKDFTVIELTPDTHLGARAEYAGTFIQAGMTYTEVLAAMILNARAYRPGQTANTRTSVDNIQNPLEI